MNWNLQTQILIPISLVVALGLAFSTYFNVRELLQNESQRVQTQIENLFGTLSPTSIPLNESVLRQVEQISGIHLVVKSESGVESSFPPESLPIDQNHFEIASETSAPIVSVGGAEYSLFKQEVPPRQLTLLAYYPREQFTTAVNRVVYPQIVSGLVTLVVIGILVTLISRNVTAPIKNLQEQVSQIADGDFSLQTTHRRRDEIGQLCESINEMAGKLQRYEAHIRSQEKLLTLDQMGGGIAHQMKNSITGCRLALDFHKQQCDGDKESLEVATRQLTFMEDFQRRFLAIAKESTREKSKTDLAKIVQDYAQLLEHFAKHLHVQLHVTIPTEPVYISGNENLLQQLSGNLITNAIEAASANAQCEQKSVSVQVVAKEQQAILTVVDTGIGVPEQIGDRLFDPLVTTKADGVGLGLAIVKQAVEEHAGSIEWSREDRLTQFKVRFPLWTK